MGYPSIARFSWGHERGYEWHRVGHFMSHFPRIAARFPVGRYVDDLFGESREGVFWHEGRMLDLVSSLLGCPCDDEQSVSDSIQMLRLSVDVAVRWADKLVEMFVAK